MRAVPSVETELWLQLEEEMRRAGLEFTLLPFGIGERASEVCPHYRERRRCGCVAGKQ